MKMKFLFALICSLTFLFEIESKVIDTSITYYKFKRENDSIYLTKFSEDIGNGELSLRIKFSKPLIQTNRDDNTTLSLAVIPDDQWEEYGKTEGC